MRSVCLGDPPLHELQNYKLSPQEIEHKMFSQCCRCETLEMDPLFKTALVRTFGFFLWTLFSAWLFSAVEYTQKDNGEEKHQLLLSLYDFMASEYNMTIEEFNNFSNLAHEALSEPKPQWTYSASVNFVLQALTTIGENEHEKVLLH